MVNCLHLTVLTSFGGTPTQQILTEVAISLHVVAMFMVTVYTYKNSNLIQFTSIQI